VADESQHLALTTPQPTSVRGLGDDAVARVGRKPEEDGFGERGLLALVPRVRLPPTAPVNRVTNDCVFM
jgi:hypothetical protein